MGRSIHETHDTQISHNTLELEIRSTTSALVTTQHREVPTGSSTMNQPDFPLPSLSPGTVTNDPFVYPSSIAIGEAAASHQQPSGAVMRA